MTSFCIKLFKKEEVDTKTGREIGTSILYLQGEIDEMIIAKIKGEKAVAHLHKSVPFPCLE